jgi:hypothetical protein
MVLHRVGSAAGRKACAGSNPALSASKDLRIEIYPKFQILLSGSGLRAILNS